MGEFFKRRFVRQFTEGDFSGKVVDYDTQTGYRILYEDGDTEDLKELQLLQLLAKSKPSKGEEPELADTTVQEPDRSALPHADASRTVEEYVLAVRGVAKRKRRHTAMKRAGLLVKKPRKPKAVVEEGPARLPLHKPPEWARDISREGRVVRLDCSSSEFARASRFVTDPADGTLYRLDLRVESPHAIVLRWHYPTGYPANSNAWVGLFAAEKVSWHAEHGEVPPGNEKLAWRTINRNAKSGEMRFGSLKAIPDGKYVLTLQRDYGRLCVAATRPFVMEAGVIQSVSIEGALYSDNEKVNRKQRQLGAAIDSFKTSRADDEAEELDERCYFPLTNIDCVLQRNYLDSVPLLKGMYRVVDKESYLDWGLTSDFESTAEAAEVGGEHRLRKRSGERPTAAKGADVEQCLISTQYCSDLPTAASHVARRSDAFGLGGGTLGSEGYGEATPGSVHKLGVVLQHLRQMVLVDLQPGLGWGMLWDLGPSSTFLDIGSGYGKVVFHLRLLARMRSTVGVECVQSRHQIALKSKQRLEAEERSWSAAKSGRDSPESILVDTLAPTANDRGGAGACVGSGPTEAQSTSRRSADSTAVEPGDAAPGVATVSAGEFYGVEFRHEDATAEAKLVYTHIYIFDWVFSKETLKKMAKVLQASPFYVLLSFRPPAEWWGNGLVKVQPVAKVPGFRTSGKESMTCFIYINLEKLPEA